MEYTRLGKRGPRVSKLGLGLWQAGSLLWRGRSGETLSSIKRGIRLALEHGINFFDTAEIYGGGVSERILGEAIREHGLKDDVVVATKVAGFRWTLHDIEKAVKRSTARLGFEPTIVQHHWPPPFYASLCRLAKALEHIVNAGLASFIGLSNYTGQQIEKIMECMRRHEPVSNQLLYNLAYRVPEVDQLPVMIRYGMTLIAWSPLAKGALAGLKEPKTPAQRTDRIFILASRDRMLRETLSSIAARHGIPQSVVALRWIIEKGHVPIPGFRKEERVKEYITTLRIKLSADDLRLLDSVSAKYKLLDGGRYKPLQRNRYVPGFLQKFLVSLLPV